MRITIIQGAFLPIPPLKGGAVEKAWFALGREFAALGHTVNHISRHYPSLPQEEEQHKVRHIRVKGYDAPASLKYRLGLDLLYSRRALAALPASDIVVSNTFWLPLLYRRQRRGRLYVHVARFPKGQLKYYAKNSVLQTVSEPIRRAILSEVPDALERCSVVPYPLSNAYFEVGPITKTKTFLYAGRLHPEKGVHLLIEAFREVQQQLPDWRLRIVGPWLHSQGGAGEDYLAELKSKAEGLEIYFTGPIFDEAKLVQEYHNAAVFCYPSLAEKGETFGLSALEGMAGGAVPIVSALPCFGDFITHENNGLIFDHRRDDAVSELANQLLRIARQDKLRENIAGNALKTAAQYRLGAIAQQYLNDFTRFVR